MEFFFDPLLILAFPLLAAVGMSILFAEMVQEDRGRIARHKRRPLSLSESEE